MHTSLCTYCMHMCNMLWAVENTATVAVTTMVSMQEKAHSVIWVAEDNPLQQCSEIFYCTYGRETKGNMCHLHSPGCRESSIYHILWLHICHPLNLIKIEWVLSRDGTIETCLHKSGPIVLEHQLSTIVILTNAGNAWVYNLKHNAHNMHFSHVFLITYYVYVHLHKAKVPMAISFSPKSAYSHLLSKGTMTSNAITMVNMSINSTDCWDISPCSLVDATEVWGNLLPPHSTLNMKVPIHTKCWSTCLPKYKKPHS